MTRALCRTIAGSACAVAALAGPARAQTAPAAQAAAQALFDQAKGLTAAGKYAEACPKLAESQRLEPSTGTQFYLADCLEHQGKLASAWLDYVEAADRAKLAGQAERETFARKRAEALLPRLSKLAVEVPEALRAAPGVEVKRDGVVVGPAQWGTPVPVDVGSHALTATAPGRVPWEGRVVVDREGVSVTATVPVLAVGPTLAPLAPDAPSSPPTGALRTAGLVTGGVGVAALGVGLGLGGLALSKRGQIGTHCNPDNTCDPTGLTLRHDAVVAATASTWTVVGGAALLGAGAVLLIVSRPRAPVTGFSVGPRGVSIDGSF